MITLTPLGSIAPAAIEALLDAAFGRDRHTRTAYRIRHGMPPLAALSFAAVEDGALIGSLQSWPIALHRDSGTSAPLAMVGPVAVRPDRQGEGIGQCLMRHMLATADAANDDMPLMLIGDPTYYGRFFGFTADFTAQWRTPGQVDQHRLLARGANIPADAGMLGPRQPALA